VHERQRTLVKGETARRRLGLPFLGEVTYPGAEARLALCGPMLHPLRW